MTSKTALRNLIKAMNQQLGNSALNLSITDRQAMLLRRETAYSAVKMLQAGINADSFLQANGVEVNKTSGKDKSTWDTEAFSEYARRGCATTQMPMSFRASRVGRARVVQASMTSAGTRKQSASLSSMTAHKSANKAKDVRIAMMGAPSAGTRYTSTHILKDGVKSTRVTAK
jgi:hypothetical protein